MNRCKGEAVCRNPLFFFNLILIRGFDSQHRGRSGASGVRHKRSSFCTCDLVADQLAGLDLADATEQAAELLLGHVLGQVVDNEVGLAVVI